MKTLSKVVVAAALAAGASAAHGGTTSVNFESSADKSIKKLGSFTGTATYDDAAGLLTITVNNTSSASGARLTAVAFDVVGSSAAVYHDGDVAGTKADEDVFDDARSKRGKGPVKGKPLGTFEAGAGINGKFNPPGKKLANKAGVAAGASRTFTFDVANGAGLTAADFLSGNNGLAAAFRGKKVDKVGSAIVAGSITSPGGGNNSGGDDVLPPIIDIPDLPPIIPPVNIGDTGSNGGNPPGGSPTAVPLPPAAFPALATFAALALPKLKRKLASLL
jgi:hypothetical protein